METTEQDILKLAQKHNLTLNEDTIEFANIGLDFQVAFGTDNQGQQWVLRLPRRKDAFLKTKQEKKTLDLLNAADIPFEVPKWEIYSEELIAYQALKGLPAVTTDAETQETTWAFDENNLPFEYIKTLGQALAALHSVQNEAPKEISMNLRKNMKQRMDHVKNNYEVNPHLWERWQKWVKNVEVWPAEAGFIHGDMYPGHTLIEENYSVSGIIDWTEAKMGDISNDFVSYYMLFGEAELEKLIAVYDKAGGYTWSKMKEHIIELNATQAITIAEFASSSGSDEYKNIAVEMLKNGN